jgi:hypothetical protein
MVARLGLLGLFLIVLCTWGKEHLLRPPRPKNRLTHVGLWAHRDAIDARSDVGNWEADSTDQRNTF